MPFKQRPERVFVSSSVQLDDRDPRNPERLSLLLLGKALCRWHHHVIACLRPREERQRQRAAVIAGTSLLEKQDSGWERGQL